MPTEASLSPWSEDAMHGGPPTMLMARAIERFQPEPEMVVKRLTVELLRPVGQTPLDIRCRLVRPGRKVQLVEASLWNGEQEVARTTAVRIRSASVDVPQAAETLPHDQPESLVEWKGGWRGGPAYHVLATEIRGGRDRVDGAPGWAWFRLRLPLLAGEEPSGLQRVCAAADFPNGISYLVDPRRTSFVNPDLTIYVRRLPADEWVLVDAKTWLDPDGTGMAEGALYDRRGRIGRSVQSLLVEPRA
ncbi:MAG TPA: thioesterase family protein [Candidatus Dormibacteraeota bacterium]|nr:thioesterase family protein [Candidatus Dormibacteraeota bacterium]